ncbi:MAG: hypothetical protein IKM35_03800 [Bacteroidaceae bacterium]|nr:hypothetical protein [Bacteroidaceae bacterium]
MKHSILIIAAMTAIMTMNSCQSSKDNAATQTSNEEKAIERTVDNSQRAMPRVIVYKTKADYSNHVPVNMNDNKSEIASYPDPVDVKPVKHPTQLQDGYLLDNFGIGRNVAYLDYTYEEYAALPQVPDMATLMQHIIELNPLTEYYISGDNHPRGSEGRSVEALNQAIANGMDGFNKIEL